MNESSTPHSRYELERFTYLRESNIRRLYSQNKSTFDKNLSFQELIVLQSVFLLETTNSVRAKIELGNYQQFPSAEAYHYIHADHMAGCGALAVYKPDKYEMNKLEHSRYRYRWDPQAFEVINTFTLDRENQYQDERTCELRHPIRFSDNSNVHFMGLPSELLFSADREKDESLPYLLHQKVDSFIQQHGYQAYLQRYTPDQIAAGNPRFTIDDNQRAFFIAAATILDHWHFFIDGNGRATEDWMVEMMRRFYGDIRMITTWSENGLRSQGLDLIDDENLQLSHEYQETYREKELLLL